jgi:IS30 family transposase
MLRHDTRQKVGPATLFPQSAATYNPQHVSGGCYIRPYFCDPRSPWQKGAVENANGRLRRYLPSDAPADRLTADSLQALADRFNATPRRCLGYRTPAEVFNGRLDPTPGGAAAGSAVSH